MDYIEEFTGQAHFHSHGKFTLGVQESRAKLSQFQLEPGLFLAKWVQAGVALGSEKIRVELGDLVTVTLMGSDQTLLDVDRLVANLETPLLLPAATPEACLLVGMLACRSLFLHIKDPRQGLLLELLPGEARARPTAGAGSDWSVQISTRPQEGLDLRGILQRHCGFCPVPIEVNGEFLESAWDHFAEADYRVAEAYLEGEGPARLRLPDPLSRPCWCVCEKGQYKQRGSHDPRAFLLSYPGPKPAHWDTALAVSASLQGLSRLLWVKAGVVIEEEFVDLGTPGMFGVVSAHYLGTDLSQFKLRKDELYQARLALLREQSQQLLRLALECPLPIKTPPRVAKPLEDWLKSART